MSTLSKAKKIAITGSMGSGKSEVLRYLESKGFKTFSADEYVSSLYQHDRDLIQSIQQLVSENILVDGEIDKNKLKKHFFKDNQLKSQIENLVHQKVYDAIQKNPNELTFFEIPLLFETNKQDDFEEVIMVSIRPELQRQRLIHSRGFQMGEIEERLSAQMDIKTKESLSDVLILNNYGLDYLHQQIDAYLKRRGYDTR